MHQLVSNLVSERRLLLSFVAGMVRDLDVAEDICQEAWLRLVRARGNGTRIENEAAWCRAVARNLILHHWRDRRNDPVLVDSELLEKVELAFQENASSTEYWEERATALRQCLSALPPRSREVLALRYDTGLSIDAMARSLDQTATGIMKALSRVRKALATCVDKRLAAR
ncbi:MAG: sigma-70 family RNA polymerase sigma factor [Verrucomicrobiota bacterium]